MGYRFCWQKMRPCDEMGGDVMRRVVVDMQNALFADAISTALKKFNSDFDVYQSEKPDKTAELCFYVQAIY